MTGKAKQVVYYYQDRSKKRIGPLKIDALLEARKEGLVRETTLVWRSGLPEWVEFKSVSELSSPGFYHESLYHESSADETVYSTLDLIEEKQRLSQRLKDVENQVHTLSREENSEVTNLKKKNAQLEKFVKEAIQNVESKNNTMEDHGKLAELLWRQHEVFGQMLG